MKTNCRATNASGQQCAAHVRPGDEWCRWHDPKRAAERKEWQRRGGRGKSTSARLKKLWDSEQLTMTEVSGLLSGAMIATLNGEVDASVLTALAGGARALLAVQEATELQRRLTVLEDLRERTA